MNQCSVDCVRGVAYSISCDLLIVRNSWKKSGTSASVAIMHSAEKRQKMSSKGMRGMKIIEMAVKKAAEPSMSDDTLVTLPFSFMLLPISIAITVPMMLQGPPMQFPMRNIAMQYCHAMLVNAKETINIMMELNSKSGLKKRARLLNLSTRKPTAVPPIRLPMSIILAMNPFSSSMLPPLLSKKIGSQNNSPQMHPLRQEQPRTQRGTLGRHMTEKIPYLSLQLLSYSSKVLCGAVPLCYNAILFPSSFAMVLPCSYVSPSERSDYSFILTYSASSGFYLRSAMMRKATATAKPPVKAKLQTHDSLWDSRRLHRLEAMMLPTFAFIAQIPIKPVTEDAHHPGPASGLEEAVEAHEDCHKCRGEVACHDPHQRKQHVANTSQKQSRHDVILEGYSMNDTAKGGHSE